MQADSPVLQPLVAAPHMYTHKPVMDAMQLLLVLTSMLAVSVSGGLGRQLLSMRATAEVQLP